VWNFVSNRRCEPVDGCLVEKRLQLLAQTLAPYVISRHAGKGGYG
jgi:hypothetical protein